MTTTTDLGTEQVESARCEHVWQSYLSGGKSPITVRTCQICGWPDWGDLNEQLANRDSVHNRREPTVTTPSTDPIEVLARRLFDDEYDSYRLPTWPDSAQMSTLTGVSQAPTADETRRRYRDRAQAHIDAIRPLLIVDTGAAHPASWYVGDRLATLGRASATPTNHHGQILPDLDLPIPGYPDADDAPPMPSPLSLVDHARREMELLGEFASDPAYAQSIVAAVAAFASYGHSGGSAQVAREQLAKLLNQEALTPITSDPAEWIDRSAESGSPWWQNTRDSRAMSHDGGATYWLVDDPARVVNMSAEAR